MKKKILLVLTAFLACHGLQAQNTNGQRYFNLVLPDNTLVSYGLTDGVDIHFQDSVMVVNNLSFCMEDGVKYYFSEEGPIIGGDGTQTTEFTSGWNWYSTYIEQTGIDGLQMLKDGLGANGVQIKAQVGFTSYYEGTGWVGTLSSLNNESSYKIKTDADCVVSMTGTETSASAHPITLTTGWNWIGYPSPEPMSVTEAFSGITPCNGDLVKAQNAYATYYEGMGWIGGLQTLNPGMGLLYRSYNSNPVTIVYPEDTGAKDMELAENQSADNNHWRPNLSAYPNNMTVTAVVELDGTELVLEPVEGPANFELAAFANGECRGSARLMYVEPLNRYMAFLTIAGDETTDLTFSLYDAETCRVETQNVAALQYESDAIVGSLTEPYVIRFNGNTGVDEWADSQIVDDKLYVKSPNKDGFVVISDVLGRVVFNQRIGEACVIDLTRLAPNTLYIIKVNNQTLKFVRR
jgi:hypothetical protein